MQQFEEESQDEAFQSLIGIQFDWNTIMDENQKQVAKFQSLIGIQFDWNARAYGAGIQAATFQSLIGIQFDWNRRQLKSLLYLFFKVHLRLPSQILAF